MFTDIEESTALTQRLGDARAQEVVRAHNNMAREQIARFGGREIKHTGDGVMATFVSASSAVAAAVAMQRESRLYNEAHPESSFVINVGLNAGEPVAEDADVFGSAVQLAARACAAARGGRVLATNVIRELVYGKGVLFDDQGPTDLKGFDEPVRLFDVAGVEPGWDEVEAHQEPRPRWIPVVASIAALVAIVVIAVVALSGLASDGGDAGANHADPLDAMTSGARYLRSDEKGSTEIVSLTGDCISSDTHVSGLIYQEARGDIVGVSHTEYDATIELERDCRGIHLQTTGGYELNDGTFSNRTQGFSLETLGDNISVSRFSSTIALGFIWDGTGAYEGVTGFEICRSDTLRNEGELTNTSQCEHWQYPADARPSVIVASVSDTDELSTRIGSGAPNNRFRYLVGIHNTSDQTIDAPVLSIAVTQGAEVRAVAPASVTAAGDLSWRLGSLAPGEMQWTELLVEVNRVETPDLIVTPQLTINGKTTVGWPATVRVRD